jgi:hypothetical protein
LSQSGCSTRYPTYGQNDLFRFLNTIMQQSSPGRFGRREGLQPRHSCHIVTSLLAGRTDLLFHASLQTVLPLRPAPAIWLEPASLWRNADDKLSPMQQEYRIIEHLLHLLRLQNALTRALSLSKNRLKRQFRPTKHDILNCPRLLRTVPGSLQSPLTCSPLLMSGLVRFS